MMTTSTCHSQRVAAARKTRQAIRLNHTLSLSLLTRFVYLQ